MSIDKGGGNGLPQIFHPSFNTVSKVSIFGAVFIVAGAGAVVAAYVRSGYSTNAGVIRDQPVPFSHQQHVSALGIDCRYCHTSVETSAYAGMPPVKTCMNCHQQIWVGTELLAPVRDSYKTNQPIEWNRVHKLGDYVYFNHGVHVAKGVGCTSCHGQIDQMQLIRQHGSLLMEWCLDCHREPEKNVRPRDRVFDFDWNPTAAEQKSIGERLKQEYDLKSMIHCSTCHR
jgi:Cytochrome c7 and related cytochrome c